MSLSSSLFLLLAYFSDLLCLLLLPWLRPIKPETESDFWVLCDRSFPPSLHRLLLLAQGLDLSSAKRRVEPFPTDYEAGNRGQRGGRGGRDLSSGSPSFLPPQIPELTSVRTKVYMTTMQPLK